MEGDGGIIVELCDEPNVDALQLVSKLRKQKRAADEAFTEGSLPNVRDGRESNSGTLFRSQQTEGPTGVRSEYNWSSNGRDCTKEEQVDSSISLLNYLQSPSCADSGTFEWEGSWKLEFIRKFRGKFKRCGLPRCLRRAREKSEP